VGKDGALHPEAVGADLLGVALAVAGEEGDPALFDAALRALSTTRSEPVRQALVGLLGAAEKPELAAHARELVLDPKLQLGEAIALLDAQLARPEARDAAWGWLKANLPAVLGRFPPARAAGVMRFARGFCDEAHEEDVRRVFAPKVEPLEGGPRSVANALESIHLCVARRKAQEPSLVAFFGKQGKKGER
jgi:alanyl aminopeptidase